MSCRFHGSDFMACSSVWAVPVGVLACVWCFLLCATCFGGCAYFRYKDIAVAHILAQRAKQSVPLDESDPDEEGKQDTTRLEPQTAISLAAGLYFFFCGAGLFTIALAMFLVIYNTREE